MIYPPNFTDSRVIAFCGVNGPTVDGFYKSLGNLGYTGSIDDRWKSYLITKYGYFNGLHINGYENESTFNFNAGASVNNILLEDGFSILQEDGIYVFMLEG